VHVQLKFAKRGKQTLVDREDAGREDTESFLQHRAVIHDTLQTPENPTTNVSIRWRSCCGSRAVRCFCLALSTLLLAPNLSGGSVRPGLVADPRDFGGTCGASDSTKAIQMR
jgi:hypothetical protein